ncbi:MAG: TM0106 family RecB-like putative nuclease [Cyanobacteria bacterium P01_H01_bin.121]
MLLTDDHFISYQRCQRRAFLEVLGEPTDRVPPSDYLLKLIADSRQHRQQVLAQYDAVKPTYPMGDKLAAATATAALMQEGTPIIQGGVLAGQTLQGITLTSAPDLLVRQPGTSNWGEWVYVPVQMRLGRRPKLEYQLTTAYQAHVLAQVQGVEPPEAWLMLRDRGRYAVTLAERLPQMQELLHACLDLFATQREPEVFIARNRCNLCQWFNACYSHAQAQQHLSLLPGVTPKRYAALKSINVTTLESLAATSSQTLLRLPGIGEDVAYKLVRQARSTLQNRPLLADWPEAIPPTASVELYFDIEAQPDLNLAYLHGVWVVDRSSQAPTFHAFLAEQPAQEAQVWQQFLDLVLSYPDAPIFHFCTYEADTIKRLARLYGTDARVTKRILRRCIDIHEWVTETVTLPVESYALKPIARWLGFQWRDSDANGAQAIYWYEQWLKTGERHFLDSIVSYNEDDCRATHHVKAWLTEFLTAALDTPLQQAE